MSGSEGSFSREVADRSLPRPIIRGVVSNVNNADSRDSEYTVDVIDLTNGQEIPGVSVVADRFNGMSYPQENQQVLVLRDNSAGNSGRVTKQAYVIGVLHSEEFKNPPGQAGDWRQVFSDNAVIESFTNNDGNRLLQVGKYEQERGDLEAGYYMDATEGSIEGFSSANVGFCFKADGTFYYSGLEAFLVIGTPGAGGAGATGAAAGGPGTEGEFTTRSGGVGGGPNYDGQVNQSEATTTVSNAGDLKAAAENPETANTVGSGPTTGGTGGGGTGDGADGGTGAGDGDGVSDGGDEPTAQG